MNKILYIAIVQLILFSLVSCKNDFLDNYKTSDIEVPEGYVKVPIDVSKLGFGSQSVTTRSGNQPLIATPRELDMKNMKVFIFDRTGSTNPLVHNHLIEIQDVILDYDAAGNPRYFTVVNERDTPVGLIGIANMTNEKIIELLGGIINGVHVDGLVTLNEKGEVVYPAGASGNQLFTFLDFGDFAQLHYSYAPSDPDNPLFPEYDATGKEITNLVLKNLPDNSGVLPIYTASINFDRLDPDELAQWEADGNSLISVFAYSRIDVMISDPNSTAQLKGIKGLSVPSFGPHAVTGDMQPYDDRVETPEVTPNTNIPQSASFSRYPTGIDDTNYKTRYIQGLYIYPTAPFAHSPSNQQQDKYPVYVIVRITPDGGGADRFYKLMVKYDTKDADGNTTTSFFINNSTRYLINITEINSAGYPSYDEAVAGPTSNLKYNITVDAESANIVTNGSYYLGVNRDNFQVDLISYDSNMKSLAHNYNLLKADDVTWTVDNINKVANVRVNITYKGGTLGTLLDAGDVDAYKDVDVNSLTKEITTNGNIKYTYLGLYNSETGEFTSNSSDNDSWKDNFGEHVFLISIPFDIVGSPSLNVRVGELERKVDFALNRTILTDYSDQAFVNNLVTGDVFTGAPSSSANSYIINPAQDVKNVYLIPVTERIQDFWSNYANTKVHDAISHNNWSNETSYTVEKSWYDGSNDDWFTVSKDFSQTGGNVIRIEFDGNSAEHQNFVLNVKKDGKILWSWHLWVTDYNPYVINDNGEIPLIGNANSATTVKNGALHRYGGTSWNAGGMTEGKMLMDRNLGALGTADKTSSYPANKGQLFYQYGRKDPFPGKAGKWSTDDSSFATENAGAYSYTQKGVVNYLEDVIVDPSTFIVLPDQGLSNNYTFVRQIKTQTLLWHDYQSNIFLGSPKSIFDPSPLGFKVPNLEVFSNVITLYNPYSSDPRPTPNGTWSANGNNGYIYSEGGLDVYFPPANYIESHDGNVEGSLRAEGIFNVWGTEYPANYAVWTVSPASAGTTTGVHLASTLMTTLTNGNVESFFSLYEPQTVFSRGNACYVRPIQE